MYRQTEKVREYNTNRIRSYGKQRIGTARKMNNGMLATIIDYKGHRDITIQFEDGYILKHRQVEKFLNGAIRHPLYNANLPQIKDKTGTVGFTHTSHIPMQVVAYRNNKDIDVMFNGDFLLTGVAYKTFKTGRLMCKYGNITITEIAYVYKGITNYICKCNKCGKLDVMDATEIKSHHC